MIINLCGEMPDPESKWNSFQDQVHFKMLMCMRCITLKIKLETLAGTY